jgi:hypothetical protein
MVILGLLLVALGALAIVCGLFASDVDGGQVTFLGVHLSPAAFFLVGVAAAVAIWWGLWILKYGSKRSRARRREQKRLEELSEKLDSVDDSRRVEMAEDEDRNRRTL